MDSLDSASTVLFSPSFPSELAFDVRRIVRTFLQDDDLSIRTKASDLVGRVVVGQSVGQEVAWKEWWVYCERLGRGTDRWRESLWDVILDQRSIGSFPPHFFLFSSSHLLGGVFVQTRRFAFLSLFLQRLSGRIGRSAVRPVRDRTPEPIQRG